MERANLGMNCEEIVFSEAFESDYDELARARVSR